ncbi:MAG: type II toxin-antitoxin system RelE/ParE family toxin [Bacteroidetes bacterium]|nr:type II toxin-antitoxin system RelE/ParE family toxin [Bacteroidota bacterium]
MKFEIFFSEGAEKDFNEITEWYKRIRTGLDFDFILCLENEIELIKREPLIYKQVSKKIRKAIIHRFPFNVFYVIEETTIVIIAISHHKRSKKTITKKLKRK